MGPLRLSTQEPGDSGTKARARLLAAALPHSKGPPPDADEFRGLGETQLKLPTTNPQLHCERVVLVALKFGSTGPQRDRHASQQNGYITQMMRAGWNERFRDCGGVVGYSEKSSRVPDRWGAWALLDVGIDRQFPTRRPMLRVRAITVSQEQQKRAER